MMESKWDKRSREGKKSNWDHMWENKRNYQEKELEITEEQGIKKKELLESHREEAVER